MQRKGDPIRMIAGMLCLVLLLQAGLPAQADSLPGLEIEISEEEKKEAEARAEAKRYQELYDGLDEELDEANAELDELLDEIAEAGRQLSDAQDAVALYTKQQADNETLLTEQRTMMAKRIQYMYEQKQSSFWEVLTGARSLAEVMNSADYIRSLSEYDNEMMEEYKATLAESERLKEESLKTEEEVLSLQAELTDKRAEMDEKVQAIVDKMSDFQALMSESEAAAEKYAASAAQKKSELEALKLAIRQAEEEAARKRAEEAARKQAEEERAQAEEAAAAAEEARRKAEEEAEAARRAAEEEARRKEEESSPGTEEEKPGGEDPGTDVQDTPWDLRWALNDSRGSGSIDIDPDAVNPTGHTNLELLASILECECGSQPYEAQVAVANVIFNRIQDPHFQTTLYDVIMGVGQFTPVDNGMLRISLVKGARETCTDIARDCFNGARAIGTRWLYFCSIASWNNNPKNHTESVVLGAHVFYY